MVLFDSGISDFMHRSLVLKIMVLKVNTEKNPYLYLLESHDSMARNSLRGDTVEEMVFSFFLKSMSAWL